MSRITHSTGVVILLSLELKGETFNTPQRAHDYAQAPPELFGRRRPPRRTGAEGLPCVATSDVMRPCLGRPRPPAADGAPPTTCAAGADAATPPDLLGSRFDVVLLHVLLGLVVGLVQHVGVVARLVGLVLVVVVLVTAVFCDGAVDLLFIAAAGGLLVDVDPSRPCAAVQQRSRRLLLRTHRGWPSPPGRQPIGGVRRCHAASFGTPSLPHRGDDVERAGRWACLDEHHPLGGPARPRPGPVPRHLTAVAPPL
jgi:hypothetical protein